MSVRWSARFSVALSGATRSRSVAMTESLRPPKMTADDVRGFLGLMDARGIRVWLDEGWG
jgi:hypothetical protein